MLSEINLLTTSFKSFVCSSWVTISIIIFRLGRPVGAGHRRSSKSNCCIFSKTHGIDEENNMGRLDINMSFNHDLPFFDQGVQSVTGKKSAMEIRQFFKLLNY